MHVKIETSWGNALREEFEKDYFRQLTDFVRNEYSQYRCYPPGKEIFNAFNLCPLDRVKVVILGQDPYHGPGQAEGLCFSVKTGVALPPSLVNIYKEVEGDTGMSPLPVRENRGGSLVSWAEQGVFLLNTCLTVREHAAFSHSRQGWEGFTDAVIETISRECEHVVFLLWGGPARNKKRLIDTTKHLVLESVHPSPLSANRGGWFGNHHFTRCNEWLKERGLTAVEW